MALSVAAGTIPFYTGYNTMSASEQIASDIVLCKWAMISVGSDNEIRSWWPQESSFKPSYPLNIITLPSILVKTFPVSHHFIISLSSIPTIQTGKTSQKHSHISHCLISTLEFSLFKKKSQWLIEFTSEIWQSDNQFHSLITTEPKEGGS